MELKQLEYFIVLCKELHFTRAAEKLGITQPSLSQQIRLLEHEVGMPLFDRIGKTNKLTEAGEALLHHSYNVFHELSQARAAISELQGLRRGALKVGALLTAVNDLLPPTIIGFHDTYPNVELSIKGLRTGDIYKGLLENELDLGITFLPVEHSDLKSIPLYEDELAVAVPKDYPLSEHACVTLDRLKDVPSVLLPDDYFLRQLVNVHCRSLSFEPEPVLEMTTMESIIHMVSKGIGITILPKAYLDHVNHLGIRTIALREPDIPINVGLVYRKNKHLCAATRVFMEELIQAVKGEYDH